MHHLIVNLGENLKQNQHLYVEKHYLLSYHKVYQQMKVVLKLLVSIYKSSFSSKIKYLHQISVKAFHCKNNLSCFVCPCLYCFSLSLCLYSIQCLQHLFQCWLYRIFLNFFFKTLKYQNQLVEQLFLTIYLEQVLNFILFIQLTSLILVPSAENFSQSSPSVPSTPFNIFFLKGSDPRLLNSCQQIEITQMITSNSLKTSTYVYNSSEAKRKYRNWVETFPWIKPHYAIKSNPSLPLLHDLINEGSNFDCASKSQLELLLNLGVNASKLVYSNPVKEQLDLEWAEKHIVQLTTADTIQELVKIKKCAPQMNILWRISIKEEASDNLSTPFSGKFGDDIATVEQIQERMKEISEMGIKLIGIHFHCGSGQHGSSAFERAILNARQCIEIGRQYGHQMTILDIGGGFPAGEISQKTIEALKITETDPLNYQVIAEPGRHFSANSFYVLTKVIGKRTKNGKFCYHLNESLYHTFNCVIMDDVSLEAKNQFYSKIDSGSLEKSEIGEKKVSTLFGMTCDGMDVIAKNAFVPGEMKVGDWLCVSGMGAYTYGSRTEFNGMKSIEKIIKWSARVDENYLDLIPALAL